MPRDLILPLSILMGLTVYSPIAKWYLVPILCSLPRARALAPLLLFHWFEELKQRVPVP